MERLKEGIERFGTPLYIYDLDILKEDVSRLKEEAGEKVNLCFAMKANPFLTKQLSDHIGRVEVCSMGEFLTCKKLNIEPEKLLISGVLKKENDIDEILDYCNTKSIVTAESFTQYRLLADWCQRKQKPLCIYLRLTSGNQFGMAEEELEQIICQRGLYPLLTIQGLHYFSGTQKRKIDKIQKELNYLDEYCTRIEKNYKFKILDLEYGPGLFVPYFKEDFKKSTKSKKDDINISSIAEAVSNMKWQGRVTLEMGRAFTAGCGYYLTKVCDIKSNNERNYCIVDGGIHQMNYDGQIKGIYQPYMKLCPDRPGLENEEKWTVCGSLCTVNDVLCQNVSLANLKVGDVLIFERAGAYSATEGMALFLSHQLPEVVIYSNQMGFEAQRKRRPTYEWNMSGGGV